MPKCRSCGKEIIFIKLESGKSMPIDAKEGTFYTKGFSGNGREKFFDMRGHAPHWSTCDKPEQFRKKKGPEQKVWPGPIE